MKQQKDKIKINGIDIEVLKNNHIFIDDHNGDFSGISISIADLQAIVKWLTT